MISVYSSSQDRQKSLFVADCKMPEEKNFDTNSISPCIFLDILFSLHAFFICHDSDSFSCTFSLTFPTQILFLVGTPHTREKKKSFEQKH
jgi:hypothetical protein